MRLLPHDSDLIKQTDKDEDKDKEFDMILTYVCISSSHPSVYNDCGLLVVSSAFQWLCSELKHQSMNFD